MCVQVYDRSDYDPVLIDPEMTVHATRTKEYLIRKLKDKLPSLYTVGQLQHFQNYMNAVSIAEVETRRDHMAGRIE